MTRKIDILKLASKSSALHECVWEPPHTILQKKDAVFPKFVTKKHDNQEEPYRHLWMNILVYLEINQKCTSTLSTWLY